MIYFNNIGQNTLNEKQMWHNSTITAAHNYSEAIAAKLGSSMLCTYIDAYRLEFYCDRLVVSSKWIEYS